MRKLEEDKVSCWTGVGFLVSLHLPTCGGTDNIHPFIHALCLVVVVMYVGVGDIYHQVYIGPTWYGASSASLFITAAKDSGNARRRPPFLHQWRRRRFSLEDCRQQKSTSIPQRKCTAPETETAAASQQSQQVTTSSVRHRKQRQFPLENPSALDLKDGEEALIEVVKVGALEVVVAEAVAAVEVGAEDLEAEHGEDAHDEEEEEEERGDRLDAVRQRLEQVREVPPVPTGGVGARSVGI